MTREKERSLLYECIQCKNPENLFLEFWNMVYATVKKTLCKYRIDHSLEDIKDLRNDVFAELLDKNCKKLKQYSEDKGYGLPAWIQLIAIHTVLQYIRKNDYTNIKYSKLKTSLDEIENLIEDNHQGLFEGGMILKEELKMLNTGIEQLSTNDRLLLKLYSDDVSLNNIATILQKTREAVDTQKCRAIAKLKTLIKEIR